jgi:hypothetical protein
MVQKSVLKGDQTLLTLPGTRKKNFSFHFKHNYLTTRAVKFCEIFCTCSPSSLEQDPTIESAKNNNFKFIWACSAKNGNFGVVFEKKGVKLAPNMFAPGTLMLFKLGPLGCTLLKGKVHLSMFHSSPPCKIWYTST